MSEATIEYKNSPNESTAYAVSEGQKTKVQLVATPAGDLELADNPNVDTGYLVIDGEKHKCALVAEVDGELKLPTSATDDSGYVTTQDGRQHKVKLVANITGGGTQINNQDINVTQNGIYQAEEGYTGLGTVNVNVASGSPTKFGATVDSFLGNVDANGNYVAPSEPFEINLVGVKSVDIDNDFPYKFYKSRIKKLIANDLVSVSGASAFVGVCQKSQGLEEAHFDNLEEINSTYAFDNAFRYCYGAKKITFSKLKKVTGSSVFKNAFGGIGVSGPVLNIEEVFPTLEEISNDSFNNFVELNYYATQGKPIIFPAVKKITGGSGLYSGNVFGDFYNKGTVWHFPSATEFTGYIWNGGATYPGEIHFAAANQAAIEACEGYANKWGFAGATIYFDL